MIERGAVSPPDILAAAFERDGYLICRWPLVEADLFRKLCRIAEEYVVEVALDRRSADLNQPHFTDPRLFEFVLHPCALKIAERIVGPDILLWSSQFFCKPAGTGKPVPWHADAHYWTNFIDPVRVVSIYIALDEQTAANGCLRVLPGSHKVTHGFAYRRTNPNANPFFPQGVPEEALDSSCLVDIELHPGEFVLFDGWLLHGSNANRSTLPRYSFTMRYAPTTSRVDSVSIRPLRRWLRCGAGVVRRALGGRDIYRHQVYLVQGEDRAGNSYRPRP
jgi:ectoine hydroxylase-related dioxygenase (phytanoyl-CoA dioxygenase family)